MFTGPGEHPEDSQARRFGDQPEEARLEKRHKRFHLDDQKQAGFRPVPGPFGASKSRNFGQVLRLQGTEQNRGFVHPPDGLSGGFEKRLLPSQ